MAKIKYNPTLTGRANLDKLLADAGYPEVLLKDITLTDPENHTSTADEVGNTKVVANYVAGSTLITKTGKTSNEHFYDRVEIFTDFLATTEQNPKLYVTRLQAATNEEVIANAFGKASQLPNELTIDGGRQQLPYGKSTIVAEAKANSLVVKGNGSVYVKVVGDVSAPVASGNEAAAFTISLNGDDSDVVLVNTDTVTKADTKLKEAATKRIVALLGQNAKVFEDDTNPVHTNEGNKHQFTLASYAKDKLLEDGVVTTGTFTGRYTSLDLTAEVKKDLAKAHGGKDFADGLTLAYSVSQETIEEKTVIEVLTTKEYKDKNTAKSDFATKVLATIPFAHLVDITEHNNDADTQTSVTYRVVTKTGARSFENYISGEYYIQFKFVKEQLDVEENLNGFSGTEDVPSDAGKLNGFSGTNPTLED